jgi:hypothetical protein
MAKYLVKFWNYRGELVCTVVEARDADHAVEVARVEEVETWFSFRSARQVVGA